MLGLPRASPVPDAPASTRPRTGDLIDSHGRIARDLRISLTEKCSLRCTYCMPEQGLPDIDKECLLSTEEVVRVASIAVHHLGIQEIRFTGGEPLMRADLEQIIAGCAGVVPDTPLSITTNGIGLSRRAGGLAAAGLTRVNVSLDTVDRDLFATITRRDRLGDTLAGIRAAVDAGLTPVKVNAVILPELVAGAGDLLRWCIEHGVALRFIESMPLDADHRWSSSTVVDRGALLTSLRKEFRLREVGRISQSDPAEILLVDDGPATVGIISSVSRPFCGDCDRTRITADGMIRSCLFGDHEVSLLHPLRRGLTDSEVAELWRAAMWLKPAGHEISDPRFRRPQRSMGAIGG
ncbi:GTP 3',8-cyclase MoaA [Gordonia desulfuricans]|uniref:GTP 3',8-cyclase MoaA n=1 Tax=Gordonia desulfuricans TaxID=89051 RepID=A0A7K3LIW4_9ACTN|nr:GTP 3',8-cyclase MoaA [Gordonia desulfuricans]